MAEPSIDPTGFFEFDLAKGQVHSRAGERVIVLSDSVVAPLVSAAVQNGDLTALRRLGKELGEQGAHWLGGDPGALAPEPVLGLAADLLALFGWGQLEVERWGEALVARLNGLPELDEEHLAIAALLGGMFSALTKREVACVPVTADGAFLVVDPQIAEQVWTWSRGGEGLGTIVDNLHAEGA